LIAVAGKAGAVTAGGAFGAQLCARLSMPGVERWINVDKVHRVRGQGAQDGEIVVKEDAVGVHGDNSSRGTVFRERISGCVMIYS
jgi:hypothetical protein